MQTVSSQFVTNTNANNQYLTFGVQIAWTKQVNSSYNLFTINTSTIGGPDFIAGGGALPSIINQYQYTDYSDYALGWTIQKNLGQYPYGVFTAQATVELDNTSLLFLPGFDGTIGNYIITGRPVMISAGWKTTPTTGSETIFLFGGISTQPQNDIQSRTLTMSCYDPVDFLNSFTSQGNGTVALANNGSYVNIAADQIIADLLQEAGFVTQDYVLEQSLQPNIGFFAPQGLLIGDIIQSICEAEQGLFFADEAGTLHFWNNQHIPTNNTVQWTLDENTMVDFKPENTPVINDVQVQATPRAVQANQQIWQLTEATSIPAPSTTITALNLALNPSFELLSSQSFSSSWNIAVSDATTTYDILLVNQTANSVAVMENVITSENVAVVIKNVANKPVVSDSVTTMESININIANVPEWSYAAGVNLTSVAASDAFVGTRYAVMVSTGSSAYIYQTITCTINTTYVAQCMVKGLSGVVVTIAAVENSVTLNSATVTLDGNWDTLSLPLFTTDGTHTSFDLRIYPTTAATVKVDAVMVQPPSGASITYFDGSTASTTSYIYSWQGAINDSISQGIPVGGITISADFQDSDGALPVTAVDAPVYFSSATTSSYATNLNSDGTGLAQNGSVSILSAVLSGSNYQVTFLNTFAQPVYVTQLSLYGTPAKVTFHISQEYTNAASITANGKNPANNGQPLLIQNDLIQTPSQASSDAYILVNNYNTANVRAVAEVFAVPQLQIGDFVTVTVNDTSQTNNYTVVGITTSSDEQDYLKQILELEIKQIITYFRINVSLINGTDQLAP